MGPDGWPNYHGNTDAANGSTDATGTTVVIREAILGRCIARAERNSRAVDKVGGGGQCSGISSGLLQAPLVAQCPHINCQPGETRENHQRKGDTDQDLAGLPIHFHSDLHLEELMRDGLQNKRERRKTQGNARRGRRA
jgi:hypothetical protein